MFNFLRRKPDTTFTVEQLHDGRFGIVKRENGNVLLLNDYTRKRDAIRGATRKGITLANV